jgi:hypothetical protein
MNYHNEQDIHALAANLEVVAGAAARYSDHKPGETITYHIGSETRRGVILHVTPPQQVLSQHIPLTFLCDSGHGWPDYVYQSDIIEESLCD